MNSAEEDALVLAMAEEAVTGEDNPKGQQLEYWIGGVKTDNVWGWMSGAPMDYTNWRGDGSGSSDFAQLLRNNEATYLWQPNGETDGDSGVICEMSLI